VMRSSSSLPVITDDDATEGPEGPETITDNAIAIEGKLRF